MNPAPTRTAAPFGASSILSAALEQARAEFARGGDLRALELAWRIERRITQRVFPGPGHRPDDEQVVKGANLQEGRAFPGPGYRPDDGDRFVMPGGHR